MALTLWYLLILAQLGHVPSDASSTPLLLTCGSDQIAYSASPDGRRFSVNGKSVNCFSFCGALESLAVNGCIVGDSSQGKEWRQISQKYCDRESSGSAAAHVECDNLTVDLHRRAGRKLLLQPSANASVFSEFDRKSQPQEGKYPSKFSLSPKKMAVAVLGMFLLSCALLCPCFHAKRKEVAEQAVLARDLNSMNSVSSFEVSASSERIPGTPLRVPPSPSRFSLSPQLSTVGSVHLTFSQIAKATQSFSPSARIGEGGFGTVYRAVLPDGQVVAVKRAKQEHFAALRTEFSNEVELLAKIEHRNLVKLLGYNDKGNERIIITEYVPNGTLREHLDGQYGKILDFNQRIEIAIDVAHALTYLHLYAERTIIHRDVKSSNILLTESLRAKVADFGFARTGPADADQTHISTKVKGTAGYLDPEYLKTYQLTPKSDVFSFGILLIEILSGRRPVELKRVPNERITVRWAFKKYGEGNIRDIVDPLLGEEVDEEILSKFFDLSFRCAAPTRSDRPAMKEVGEQLWEIRKDYGRTLRRE